MKLLNIIFRGIYILLAWYFSSEEIKKLLQEIEDYRKGTQKTQENNTKGTQNNTNSTQKDTDSTQNDTDLTV